MYAWCLCVTISSIHIRWLLSEHLQTTDQGLEVLYCIGLWQLRHLHIWYTNSFDQASWYGNGILYYYIEKMSLCLALLAFLSLYLTLITMNIGLSKWQYAETVILLIGTLYFWSIISRVNIRYTTKVQMCFSEGVCMSISPASGYTYFYIM